VEGTGIPKATPERVVEAVRAAQAGDRDAVGVLYAEYFAHIYRYCIRRLPDWYTAEDVASETFVHAMRKIETFAWQGKDFGAWLTTIAHNLIADHYKSAASRSMVLVADMRDHDRRADVEVQRVVETEFRDAALAEMLKKALTPEQLECVTLRFLDSMSVAETAAAMGKGDGSVRTMQFRAIRTLRRHCELRRWAYEG
jgi:RNA polymerase sigma-70 factor (ECF subfamily)